MSYFSSLFRPFFYRRWFLDALMEYTSMAYMPSIFTENAGLPIKDAPSLPKRMENNQLHRYSKVLESSHIGESHLSTRILPPCPHLKWAQQHPLNRTAPSNLYKAQKLLSLNIDAMMPPLHRQVKRQSRSKVASSSFTAFSCVKNDGLRAHKLNYNFF